MLELDSEDCKRIAKNHKDRTGYSNFLGDISKELQCILIEINQCIKEKEE